MTVSGTFTVETSDDPRFSAGTSYPLTVDASVTLDVIESVTATVPAPPATVDTTTTPAAA